MQKFSNRLMIAAAALGALTTVQQAGAEFISVNYREFANDINDVDADETYGVAAEGSVTGGWINAFSPAVPALTLADGSATTVVATGTSPGGTDTAFLAALNDTPMRAGVATFNPTPAGGFPTVTLTGLAGTFSSYDIIVYFTSNDGSDEGQISDGTTTYYFSLPGGTGSQTADLIESTDTTYAVAGDAAEASYAVFRGLTADSVTLEVRALNIAAGNGGTFVGIGGYQIKGTLIPQNDPADLDNDGDVDDADFGIAFAAFTGPNNGPSSNPAADLDGDNDVDDADFGLAFAAFTGPGGGAAAVPEPTSLALLGLGGLMIARRRR